MKRLRVLASLVGLFVFFGFTNTGSSQAVQNNEFVGGASANKDVFNIEQFKNMYEIFRQDEKVNSKFLADMEGLFKSFVLPSVDPDMGIWRSLDKNSENFEQELSELQINDCSKTDGKKIIYFGRPKFLSNGFEEKLRGLKLPHHIFLYLKDMNDSEKTACLDKMTQESPYNKGNCEVKEFKEDEYINVILNELKKLNMNYNFRFENSKIVCCSDSEEGKDLAKLINFCLYFLRFGEYQVKNFDFVMECLASRGKDLALEGKYQTFLVVTK